MHKWLYRVVIVNCAYQKMHVHRTRTCCAQCMYVTPTEIYMFIEVIDEIVELCMKLKDSLFFSKMSFFYKQKRDCH